MEQFDWRGKKVTVTGGASFIGSHLVDALVDRRAQVKVVDDLSSGKREYIERHVKTGLVPLMVADLRDPDVAFHAVSGRDVVFHLAADHGGRGYVDTQQADCAGNFHLDGVIFHACVRAKVGKVVYASSGCVYPNHLQRDPKKELYLTEEMAGPPFDCDNLYGYAKMMAEMTLRAYAKAGKFRAACPRYFTVFGPRGHVNHAVIAMLARAYAGQTPFEIWGDGTQIRNWTFVDDIVGGTIRAAEVISDGSAVNLGTTERITVKQAAEMACALFKHAPTFKFLPAMPTGPANRVASNALAEKLLDWKPTVSFAEGLAQTAEWMLNTWTPEQARTLLETKLLAR